MKILHIVRQFYPMIGGIENYVFHLASEQSKEHEVTVLTLNRSFIDGSPLPSSQRVNSINIKRISYKGSKRYPLAFSVLKHVKNYDIVHVHCVDFFIDFLVFTKFIHRKKLVLTTHGGFFHTQKSALLKKLFFHSVTRLTVAGCNRVIACGDNDWAIFSRISSRVIKIDNGINVKSYIDTPKEIDSGTLVYVGRIDHHKKIDNLIHLVKSLVEEGENVKLKIIGPDWNNLQKDLISLANELNVLKYVEFAGAISDDELKKTYQKAHLFLSASEYEGFGISAIEALSSGTLCVVHPNDSFKKLFENKEYSLLSDFNDRIATKTKVKKILHLSPITYRELSDKAREYARSFSWEFVEKSITKLY